MKTVAIARRQMAELFQNPTGLGVDERLTVRLLGDRMQLMESLLVARSPSAWAMDDAEVKVSNAQELRFGPVSTSGVASTVEIELAGQVTHRIPLLRRREMEAGDILWFGAGDLIVSERITGQET